MNGMGYLRAAGLAVAVVVASPAVAQEADGYWQGVLDTGAAKLTVGVAIERQADGALVGTLDSPDQNAFDIPLSEIDVSGGSLSFSIPVLGASYVGEWDAESNHWRGVFSQAGMQLSLILGPAQPPERSAKPAATQLPKDWAIPSDADIRKAIADRLADRPGAEMIVGIVQGDKSHSITGPGGKADADTLFEIGSMTKVFTSLILADMVLEGKVSLDDPVAQYLPEGAAMPQRSGRQITLRNLSQQDSGLPRLPDNLTPTDVSNPYADYTEEDLLAFLAGYELPREIGSQYEYSNLGIGLLGYVLARVEGTDFETLLRKRVLDPLGMKDTAISLSLEQQARFIGGFDQYMRPTKAWDMSVLAGAGGMRSTASDLNKFLKAALDKESAIAAAMRLMVTETRQAPGYMAGLGWMITPAPQGAIMGHNGGTGGFRSYMALQPEAGRAVVALTNSAVEPSATDIAQHVLVGRPLAETKPIPPAPTEVERVETELSQDQLDRVTGTYRFNPNVFLVVTREKNQVHAMITGQGSLPIFPRSPLEFFWRAVNAEIVFSEENGVITGATFTQDGVSTPLPKVN